MLPSAPGDTPEPVTVVVADDQSAVREGLVLLLGTLPGITVVGEAGDGEAALVAVAGLAPRVVLMDLNMPGCDGVEATRRVRAAFPQTRVVVLTTYSDDDSIIGALQAGALGLPDQGRDQGRDRAGRARRRRGPGRAGPRGTAAAAGRRRTGGAPAPDDERDLTPRESQVLRLIAAGQSNREIARALVVSEATVKTHVNRIFAKTGSRDRAQATRYAYTHGYAER